MSIGNIIPKHSIITKNEILNFTASDIERIKKYATMTFTKFLSDNNFASLESLVFLAKNTFNNLNDGDVIISPGDSPYKIVKIIDFLYKEDNNYVYEDNGIIKHKHLHFIVFPLSKANLWMRTPEKIDNYIKSILGDDVYTHARYVYLDYIESGATEELIAESIRRIRGNTAITFVPMNINDYRSKSETQRDLEIWSNFIIDAEEQEMVRCVSMYKPTDINKPSLAMKNVLRCNITLVLIYLYAINTLGQTPLYLNNSSLYIPLTAAISMCYYDVAATTIKSGIFAVSDLKDHFFELPEDGAAINMKYIPAHCIISVQVILSPGVVSPRAGTHTKVRLTLLNGYIFDAKMLDTNRVYAVVDKMEIPYPFIIGLITYGPPVTTTIKL